MGAGSRCSPSRFPLPHVLPFYLMGPCAITGLLTLQTLNRSLLESHDFFLQPLDNLFFKPGNIGLRDPQQIGYLLLGHLIPCLLYNLDV